MHFDKFQITRESMKSVKLLIVKPTLQRSVICIRYCMLYYFVILGISWGYPIASEVIRYSSQILKWIFNTNGQKDAQAE